MVDHELSAEVANDGKVDHKVDGKVDHKVDVHGSPRPTKRKRVGDREPSADGERPIVSDGNGGDVVDNHNGGVDGADPNAPRSAVGASPRNSRKRDALADEHNMASASKRAAVEASPVASDAIDMLPDEDLFGGVETESCSLMNADSPLKLGVAARIGDEKKSPVSVLDKDLPEVLEVPGISDVARRAARLAKYMGYDPQLC